MARTRREKISAWMAAAWQDPGFRRRQSDGLRAKWQDPEYREKISAARRRQWAAWRELGAS